MQAHNTNAFFLSTLLHAVVVGLTLFFGYAFTEQTKDAPKVFELVAGEGDNYMATEAPALGVPNPTKLSMPKLPEPAPSTPEPPVPEPVAPTPIQPAPEPIVERAPVTPAKPPPDAIRDFSKDVKRIEKKRTDRLVKKFRQEREAAERKAKEEELKNRRMTKEEFDRQNKSKKSGAGAGTASGTTKIARIDAEGIAGGVLGGSTKNKKGGAGGKALTRDDSADVLDLYFSLLRRRLHEALEKPPGLADTLVAEVEFYLSEGGALSSPRIVSSSGSDEFDRAAMEAIVHVRSIGQAPSGWKGETVRVKFRMREEDEG